MLIIKFKNQYNNMVIVNIKLRGYLILLLSIHKIRELID